MKDKLGRLTGEELAGNDATQRSGYRQRIVENAEGIEHRRKFARDESFADILGKAGAHNHLPCGVRNFELSLGQFHRNRQAHKLYYSFEARPGRLHSTKVLKKTY
jgi:hypothetical protein